MITKERVIEILNKPEVSKGIETYNTIMGRFNETDVTSDGEFQKVFRDFYQMRRFYNDDFARHYFSIMEQLKGHSEVSFKMAFERIKHINGSAEMSFSSKMIHTFNPKFPIWDSVVTTDHFGIIAPSASKDWSIREPACVKRYELYMCAFYNYMKSDEGRMLIDCFDEQFPGADISDVKKIDFILWQDR